MISRINALSMFSGGGIAETYIRDIGIDVKVANELLEERANFYKFTYPTTEMICGDISDKKVYDKVIEKSIKSNIKFLIATPPCQGMSTLGPKKYDSDKRNSLIKYVIRAIKDLNPDYVLIENVPKFTQLLYDIDGTTYFSDTAKSEKPYHIVDLGNLK